MEKENLDFLKDRLYFLGFGEQFNKTLEQKMKAGDEKFKLGTEANLESMGKMKKIHYELDFAKSKENDRWFLNNYTATLSEAGKVQGQQKIFLNFGSGLSAREAFNMLETRAVHKKMKTKDKREFEAWNVIDFTKKDDHGNNKIQMYSQGWNYDLSKALHKHPIKELQTPEQKDELMRSLRKGNLTEVNFVINKEDVKHHIAANPKDRNVIVYDANFVRLTPIVPENEKSQNQRQDRSEGLVFSAPGKNSKDAKEASELKQNDETAETRKGKKSGQRM